MSHLIIGAIHSTLAPIVPLSPRCNALTRLPSSLSPAQSSFLACNPRSKPAACNSRLVSLEWLVPAVQFNVNGQGTTLYGDGFAFWYTHGIQQIGSVFGSADGFKGIGVFFDT